MKVKFDPFSVNYGPITAPILDFTSECIAAAHNVVRETDRQIVVMMSGGIDSELVATSFLLAKIPFKVVIGRLMVDTLCNNEPFNKHDYSIAERWCAQHGVEVLYCDIDIYQQSRQLCKYALDSFGFSPQYACHMHIMKWCDSQNFFFVAGNGEMDIVLHDGEYAMMDEQREFTLLNFCIDNNLHGEFQFWKQDARLVASFIKLPTVKRLMEEHCPRILDFKHKCFSDAFNFEPRAKQTGFEQIQQWDSHLRNPMKLLMGKYDNKYYTPLSYFKD